MHSESPKESNVQIRHRGSRKTRAAAKYNIYIINYAHIFVHRNEKGVRNEKNIIAIGFGRRYLNSKSLFIQLLYKKLHFIQTIFNAQKKLIKIYLTQ